MRRRKGKETVKDNKTLDEFMRGAPAKNEHSSSSFHLQPKIKVPLSSGEEPFCPPVNLSFLYPQYPQFRDYQFEIARQCITYNTLVCLPTGLGKTHIASVIMLNYALWFPEGKIFFLAPTRPLVDQQSFCMSQYQQYISLGKITCVKTQMIESKRKDIYERKQIFFCTPQLFESDMKANRLDSRKVVLVIIDEAHKAVGNYAYTQAIKLLEKSRVGYRIVALSATPGNEKQKIQEVIDNLLITKMIVKQQDDPNVRKYTKGKEVVPVYISHSAIIRETEQILDSYLAECMTCLIRLNAAEKYLLNVKNITSGGVFIVRRNFHEKVDNFTQQQKFIIEDTLNFVHFLTRCKQSLRQSGYEGFTNQFVGEFLNFQDLHAEIQESNKFVVMGKDNICNRFSHHYYKRVVNSDGWKRIKQLFSSNNHIGSHPKMEKLKFLLNAFFSKKQNIEKKSKVIVFVHLRSTCFEVKNFLQRNDENGLFRAEMFFGQAKTTIDMNSSEGSNSETLHLPQKQQIKLLKRFKDNEINILISTSIGQEGLDIGEVDAIFCYDGGMNGISLVQRMGRTGRKRSGTVYVLLMEGKESDTYHKAMKKSKKMKRISAKDFKYYCFNPSMFPENIQLPIKYFDRPTPEQLQKIPKYDPDLSKKKTKKMGKRQSKNLQQQQKSRKSKSNDQSLKAQSSSRSASVGATSEDSEGDIIERIQNDRNRIVENYFSKSLAWEQLQSKSSNYFKFVDRTVVFPQQEQEQENEESQWLSRLLQQNSNKFREQRDLSLTSFFEQETKMSEKQESQEKEGKEEDKDGEMRVNGSEEINESSDFESVDSSELIQQIQEIEGDDYDSTQ